MSQIVEVKVPDIGDYADVPVIDICVKPGDSVKIDDALLTLESDKATMDVPSPVAGIVKEVKVKLGDKVSEGSVVVILETAGDAVALAPVPAPAPVPVAATVPAAAPAPAQVDAITPRLCRGPAKVPQQGQCDPVPIFAEHRQRGPDEVRRARRLLDVRSPGFGASPEQRHLRPGRRIGSQFGAGGPPGTYTTTSPW